MTIEKRKASGATARGRSGGRRQTGSLVPTALIEPNVLFREGLNHILAQTRFNVVIRADTVAGLPSASHVYKAPNLVLLCTQNSIETAIADITSLKATYADCRVVCSEQSYRFEDIIDLLKAGADGILLRTISADTFIKSLELVMLGERVIPAGAFHLGTLAGRHSPEKPEMARSEPEQAPKLHSSPRGYQLSERELAILKCLLLGEANKIIALKLDIAEATVKVHVKAILRKIHVQNRTQAAIWALNHLAEIDLGETVDQQPEHHSNGAEGPRHLKLSNGADAPFWL
ncbi:LuxR C-terminal-related transcriptional regulator [Methylobacterium brachythecii]|uniref:Transcriptional regulator n=1 Tax=Methylobacterium brachythecii TaxID=1176177 RepID=A0A7W6AIQ0_9HYPH|nr:response regulator transcription factor [Methylobacterium brachythecii]MBB3903176.1 two-component system nitrate/nitrite response regulator NarL [Methylobacterium brachythecii]GLS44756.1 transcriptional regulator [Methylobacterium brachythecii]